MLPPGPGPVDDTFGYGECMSDYSTNQEFAREWDYRYLRSVYAATAAAYERAAWRPPEEAFIALATELRDRGIDPDRDAVYTGAALISRGEQPPILRPGDGRRKRHLGSA